MLIGCLPTYTQVGLAGPILLSLLRLVQGIAVGGELGTAVVFMHELAPANHKTKGGSIIFLGVSELLFLKEPAWLRCRVVEGSLVWLQCGASAQAVVTRILCIGVE